VLNSQGSATSIFGYSGEQIDAYIKLVFLRARYMQPGLGVFLSRDPWSGDDLRPGSMNGWNYSLSNPVKYSDPTGHYVCDEDTGDCSTRRWHRFGASANLTRGQLRAFFGIRLTEDAGQSWAAADISNISEAVQQAAAAMDFATWNGDKPTVSNIARFFKGIMGSVRFNRSSDTGTGYSFTDPAYSGQLIQVYSNAPAGRFSPQNTVHELGHSFAQRLGGQPYDDLENNEITFMNEQGRAIHVAGGGGGRTFRGMDPYPWVQDKATVAGNGVDPTHEDFADMFLGWAYNHFSVNSPEEAMAGAARYAWMTTNMAEWIR
jgi:RHS repeat-associated protein